MSDPLSLLREYTINQQLIELEAGFLVMGENKFPCKTKTNYKTAKGKFLQLDTIWFYLKHRDLSYGKYATMCVKKKISPCQKQEQPTLLKYMTGVLEECANLTTTLTHDTASKMSFNEPKPSQSSTQSITPSSKSVSEWTLTDIFSQEKAFGDRSSILQSKKPLKGALEAFQSAVEKRKRRPEADKSASTKITLRVAKRLKPMADPKKKRTPESVIPIIVVPPTASSVINMWNAHDLFGGKTFVKSMTKMTDGARKPELEVVERQSFLEPGKTAKFHILDDIAKVKQGDWHKVAGIVVSGAEWQLKGWPWKTPAEIFDNVCAFHVHYDDEPLNSKITTWKVHRLSISKIKRYRDKSVALEFWQRINKFMNTRQNERQLFF